MANTLGTFFNKASQTSTLTRSPSVCPLPTGFGAQENNVTRVSVARVCVRASERVCVKKARVCVWRGKSGEGEPNFGESFFFLLSPQSKRRNAKATMPAKTRGQAAAKAKSVKAPVGVSKDAKKKNRVRKNPKAADRRRCVRWCPPSPSSPSRPVFFFFFFLSSETYPRFFFFFLLKCNSS